MNEKMIIKRKIHALDFAIKETELFLDTHPRDQKALHMLYEYRRRRKEEIEKFEKRFGKYIVTTDDVQGHDCWEWIDCPWPWERQV